MSEVTHVAASWHQCGLVEGATDRGIVEVDGCKSTVTGMLSCDPRTHSCADSSHVQVVVRVSHVQICLMYRWLSAFLMCRFVLCTCGCPRFSCAGVLFLSHVHVQIRLMYMWLSALLKRRCFMLSHVHVQFRLMYMWLSALLMCRFVSCTCGCPRFS